MYLCTSSPCNQLSQAQTFRIRFILLTTTYRTSDGFNLAGHFSQIQQYQPSCGTKSGGQWSLASQSQQTSRLPWSPPGSCSRRGLWSPWGHQQRSGGQSLDTWLYALHVVAMQTSDTRCMQSRGSMFTPGPSEEETLAGTWCLLCCSLQTAKVIFLPTSFCIEAAIPSFGSKVGTFTALLGTYDMCWTEGYRQHSS